MIQSDGMHGHDTTFTQEARPIRIRILIEHSVIQIEWEKLNRRTKDEIDLRVFSRRWVMAVVHDTAEAWKRNGASDPSFDRQLMVRSDDRTTYSHARASVHQLNPKRNG